MTTTLKPIELSEHLLTVYRRYLGTTFPLTGQLREQLLLALGRDEALMKGPILEATAPFKAGQSLAALVREKVAAPGFLALGEAGVLDLNRPLYRHQERAFRQIRGEAGTSGRNTIVATGTGSGKTESFLYPIIDSLLAEREAGTLHQPGVRALLLYPMNALANDQLKRLRELLAPLPDITFGRYTGETPREEGDARRRFEAMFPGEPLLPNELKSREALQASPPHILLTNYAMLEYLLLRPSDNVFFDGLTAKHWKFWVLDEVHTYNGAVACDVAMLLRRLKDRIVQSVPGRIRCIGTSATLGDGAKDAPQVAQFASDLFGEAFSADDLILAEREPLDMPLVAEWGSGTLPLYQAMADAARGGLVPLAAACQQHGIPGEVVQAAQELAQEVAGEDAAHSGAAKADPVEDDPWGVATAVAEAAVAEDVPAPLSLAAQVFLWRVLAGDRQLLALRRALANGPRRVRHLAEQLFTHTDGLAVLSTLVDLAAGARRDARALPLLPARYHVFLRALEGAFITFDTEREGALHLQLERARHMDVGGVRQRAFELSTCRRCGHPYIAGQLIHTGACTVLHQRGPTDEPEPEELQHKPEEALFRWDWEGIGEADEDEDAALRRETSSVFESIPSLLCLTCGAVASGENPRGLPCDCTPRRVQMLTRIRHRGDRGARRCPTCHYLPKHGKAISALTLGQDAPVAVIATSLFQMQPPASHPTQAALPGGGRKLIVFSDSRQDAAFFAPYVQRTYNMMLERRALMLPFETHPRALPLAIVARELAAQTSLPLFSDEERNSAMQREDRAWLWLMQEFRSTQSRLSLEGVGLLGFQISPDAIKAPPPPALATVAKFLGVTEFSVDEFSHLLHTLLMTLRRQGACTFPDRVQPDQAAFDPLSHHVHIRVLDADAKRAILAWAPSDNRLNARSDYLVRLARVHRPGIEEATLRQEARNLLVNIWKYLVESCPTLLPKKTLPGGGGTVHQLNHLAWELRPISSKDGVPLLPLWRCQRCRQITAHGLFNVCAAYRCGGQLARIPHFDDDNHYRNQYLELQPLPLCAEEHTAQIEKEAAATTQQGFIQGKVNVLSCSTTFELGVDVGELQTVLMRNVPPETANYLQRAGRAGRRADSAALVVTYAQRRAHDLHHFDEPEQMVGGRMRPPSAHVRNVELITRHVYAVAFAELFRRHASEGTALLPYVEHFFEKGDGTRTGPELMAAMLAERPARLQEALRRILPTDPDIREAPSIGLSSWAWVAGLVAESGGLLVETARLIQSDLALYQGLEDEASAAKDHKRAAYYQRMGNTVRRRPILSYLAGQRMLPKYGFPVHSVELEILVDTDAARRVELSRDLRLALGDYAPGSRIVAAGQVWESYGLKRLPNREWPTREYVACTCGWLELVQTAAAAPQTCGHCEAPLPAAKPFVVPEFGFVTSNRPSEDIGESRPQRGQVSKVYFTETRTPEEQATLDLYPVGASAEGSGVGLSLAATRRGELVVVNKGRNGSGYNLCGSCGASVPFPKKKDAIEPHEKPWGGVCKGGFRNYHLGHAFATDVLELRFVTPAPRDTAFWLSLTYALLEGASRALEIRRDDLDGCLFFPAGGTSIILFDNVPGGAGHVRLVERSIQQVVEAALRVVAGCGCGADTACYKCLLSYRNQTYHDILARGPVRDYLEHLQSACLLQTADGVYSVSAASRGAWLAGVWSRAHTLRLFAPTLALTLNGPTPYGTPDWFDTLRDTLQRGARVRLVLPETAFPAGRDAESAQLRDHLRLLLQQGLELQTVPPDAPMPEWPMVLEGEDTSRVVAWQSSDAALSEGISPATGLAGFNTSINVGYVAQAQAAWDTWVRSHGKPLQLSDSRFTGPTMNFRRLRPGETHHLWDVFAGYFRPDDRALTIRDAYLYERRHFKNVRLLLNGLLKLRGAGPALAVKIESTVPRENYQQDHQQENVPKLVNDYENTGIALTFQHAAIHDRELHITRADGTLTVVLMGSGLDFLDHQRPTPRKEIYLAAFDTTPDAL